MIRVAIVELLAVSLLVVTGLLVWALMKVRSLLLRLDRIVQHREHPEFYENKGILQVIDDVGL